MFKTSVCSYPDRGSYGNSRYRGNCSGHVIKDFVETYLPRLDGLFADPSIGSGTSAHVAAELRVRFKGTDLHQGFDLLRDDFRAFLGEDAAAVWWHPPYWDMIHYSGSQWGNVPHPSDMSRMTLPDFTEALAVSLMNIHDACAPNGHYGVLMGNLRREGRYYNLSSLVERIAPGRLVDEIIKLQHQCSSDRKHYANSFVRIGHEKLLVFRKAGRRAFSMLVRIQRRVDNIVAATWRSAVRRALHGRSPVPLDQIYAAMEPYAMSRENVHWKAKVRQVLQDERFFVRVSLGVYQLA